MKQKTAYIGILAAFVLLSSGCTQVAITGRKQLNLVPDSMVNSMALDEYKSFLKENKLSSDPAATAMVKEAGKRISAAVDS